MEGICCDAASAFARVFILGMFLLTKWDLTLLTVTPRDITFLSILLGLSQL